MGHEIQNQLFQQAAGTATEIRLIWQRLYLYPNFDIFILDPG